MDHPRTPPERRPLPDDPVGALAHHLSAILLLGIAGQFVCVAYRVIDPAVFGTRLELIHALANSAPHVFVGGYLVVQFLQLARNRTAFRPSDAASRAHTDARTHTSARTRTDLARPRPVYAGARTSDGVLGREAFLFELERQIASATADRPLSLVVLKATLSIASDDLASGLKSRLSRTLVDVARPTDLVGYLGNGLFALGMPDTSRAKGRRPSLELRDRGHAIASEFGGWIEETFVTLDAGESLPALYRRALHSLTIVPSPRIERDGSTRERVSSFG